jgi:hypothetical protein
MNPPINTYKCPYARNTLQMITISDNLTNGCSLNYLIHYTIKLQVKFSRLLSNEPQAM